QHHPQPGSGRAHGDSFREVESLGRAGVALLPKPNPQVGFRPGEGGAGGGVSWGEGGGKGKGGDARAGGGAKRGAPRGGGPRGRDPARGGRGASYLTPERAVKGRRAPRGACPWRGRGVRSGSCSARPTASGG